MSQPPDTHQAGGRSGQLSPSQASLHKPFTDALIANELVDLPEGIVGPDGKPAPKRFQVYRNNVILSLIEALSQLFPTVHKLVGEEFFHNMARVYVLQNPPDNPVLFLYGKTFAEFLESFEPVAELPYLPDVARLEFEKLQSYHAADAPPLAPEALAAISPEKMGEASFTAHPAARVLVSQWPVHTIWHVNDTDNFEMEIDLEESECVLIARPHLEVSLYPLTPAAGKFYSQLIDGEPLAVAAAEAMHIDEAFDLPGSIALMLEAGVFTDLN